MKYATKSYDGQIGAALIVSLVMLTVMTLIGLTAMQSTIMQEKMAGNSRDMNLAFEAAEVANREGENWIAGQVTSPDPLTCPVTPCWLWNAEGGASALFAATGAVFYTDPSIWGVAGVSRKSNYIMPGNVPLLEGVTTRPEFVVEFVEHRRDSQTLGQQQDLENSRSLYTVTSRGTGGTDAATAHVQSTFAKRF